MTEKYNAKQCAECQLGPSTPFPEYREKLVNLAQSGHVGHCHWAQNRGRINHIFSAMNDTSGVMPLCHLGMRIADRSGEPVECYTYEDVKALVGPDDTLAVTVSLRMNDEILERRQIHADDE